MQVDNLIFIKRFFVWFSGKVKIWIIILPAIAVLLLPMGCDPENRHKVLTFFFDGVPAPGESVIEVAPGEVLAEEPSREAGDVDLLVNQKGISRHKAARDCQRCHEQGARWSRTQLHNPLPQLCYECHTDYNAVRGYVHGPVAVGACLFCHDPHQSSYLRLLKAPQPDLCYQCHEKDDIAGIKDHEVELEGVCSRCHDPHISSDNKLLKPPYENLIDKGGQINLIRD